VVGRSSRACTVVPLENQPDGAENRERSTAFSANDGLSLKRNDHAIKKRLWRIKKRNRGIDMKKFFASDMKNSNTKKFFILTAVVILSVIFIAAQPGESDDPIVTRRVLEARFTQLSEEIAILRSIVASVAPNALPNTSTATTNIPATERDAIFADVMEYFEKMYGAKLDAALQIIPGPGDEPKECEPQLVPFEVLNPQAGQVIIFEAGAEFILRGGKAVAITGINGIPDVTAGADILNGENIGLNHLMMIPVSDGRGIHFHAESWLMVRGGYAWR
jgi:hypothetical protein